LDKGKIRQDVIVIGGYLGVRVTAEALTLSYALAAEYDPGDFNVLSLNIL
jgi:hypothetical protein